MDDITKVTDSGGVVKENPSSTADIPDEFASQNLVASWIRWKCLNCGYVYEGVEKIQKCPRCGNDDPDKFEDVD